MKSAELSTAVAEVVKEAQARIMGIGAEQYAEGDTQKFERMTLEGLLVYMEEELLDQINYSVMNILRLRWCKEAVKVIGHEAISPANLEMLRHKAAYQSALREALNGKPKGHSTGD